MKKKRVQNKSQEVETLSARPRLLAAGIGLVVFAAVIAYIPALQAGFVWDDDANVTKNMTLRSLADLREIWLNPFANQQYYPLTHTSFWINYQLWGLRPLGYHLVNVLLHALTAVLLWLALRRLSVPGAWLAAAVFALHPVHVESVAWVTERKNVLSGVFYMSALLAHLRYARIGGQLLEPRRRLFYALALVLFACALLSKTVTSTLPAVLLLLLWWKRDRIAWKDVWPLVPFFVLGLGFGQYTAWLEKHHVGAVGEEWNLTLPGKLIVAGRALWFYPAKILWPAKLTFIYPRWEVDPANVLQYLYLLAALAVVGGLLIFRRRLGKAPLVAALFYAVTISPALGFFNVYFMRYSFVQDHFQYLASIGPIALAAGLISMGLRRLGSFRSGFQVAIPAIILALLGALTWQQSRIYADSETLWRDTLSKNPSSWMAHNNLGNVLLHQNKLDEAIAHYSETLRLKPNHLRARFNMANALSMQGRVDEAIVQLNEVLEAMPDFAPGHYFLAAALASQGKLHNAAAHYEEAVRLRPRNAQARYQLANLLAKMGRHQDAMAEYEEALRIKPDHAEAHHNLAIELYMLGRYADAWREIELARQYGATPNPGFLQALSRKMSAPKGKDASK